MPVEIFDCYLRSSDMNWQERISIDSNKEQVSRLLSGGCIWMPVVKKNCESCGTNELNLALKSFAG